VFLREVQEKIVSYILRLVNGFIVFCRDTSAAFSISKAMDQMIIDHSGRLHEGVADCRADELEAAFLEGFAHGIRFG